MSHQQPIQLIVGLANPTSEYAETRHNAGAWFVEEVARKFSATLRVETKFQGILASIKQSGNTCRLLIPTTYMNHSGISVRAVTHFYQIPPEAILVVHDELDFNVGITRFKHGGGHGGHNGLRDIINHLHSNNFFRLRIGIGHPKDRNKVHDYVLSRPSKKDHLAILESFSCVYPLLEDAITGDIQKAMKTLHTMKKGDKNGV